MVATGERRGAGSGEVVSIPIGFSNGCNTAVTSATNSVTVFQSLSGFLMVATVIMSSRRKNGEPVSIPIGFSNGCNLQHGGGEVLDVPVSIPIGFSNGCNKRQTADSRGTDISFNPYRVF